MRKLGIPPENLQPDRYTGPRMNLVPVVEAKRRPLTSDTQYPIWTEWRVDSSPSVGSEGEFWKLVSFTSGNANWVRLATTGAAGTLTTLTVDAVTLPGVNPVEPTGAGTINLNGSVVASGSNPIRTHSSALNTVDIEVQLAGSSAGDPGNTNAVGLVQLNSSDFTVTANGFMSLAAAVSPASIGVDASTPPGTDPVVVDGAGVINLTGAAVANSGAPLTSNSVAANQVRMDIQVAKARSGAPANKLDAGICSFSSADFGVTADGYVTILGGAGSSVTSVTVNAASGGTNPVLPSSGNMNVYGALVAAGTTPIQTISRAANTYNVEVQIAKHRTGAPANSNDVGLVSFDDKAFFVTADGYCRLAGSAAGLPAMQTVTGDSGTAVGPDANGDIDWNGVTVANGAITQPIFIVGTPASNKMEVKLQLGAAKTGNPLTSASAGVVCFNDTQFEVDGTSGYVTLKGATDKAAGQTITGDDTGLVEPSATGNWTFNGEVVANGTYATKPVYIAGDAPTNSFDVAVQYAASAASSDGAKSGLAHFSSADFSVDSSGYVELTGGSSGGEGFVNLFEEFLGGNIDRTSSTSYLRGYSNYNWYISGSSSEFNDSSHTTSQNPGVWKMNTPLGGSSTIALASDRTGTPTGCFVLGGGEIELTWYWKITYFPGVPVSSFYGAGIFLPSSPTTEAIWISIDSYVNGGNFMCSCWSGGAQTNIDTAVPYTSDWIKTKVVINAAASSVDFFLDGVSLGTITTNIPDSALLSPGVYTQGYTTCLLDYMKMTQTLTTSR